MEKCYGIKHDCISRHCAILNDKVAIMTSHHYALSSDVVHISCVDLKSWKTATLPYSSMSLTTYRSQFVAVGGWDISSGKITNQLFTSDTGLEWQPSLPPMRTKRCDVSCISTRSPHVLVVAGGLGYNAVTLDIVELLLEERWHTVDPLPKPCCGMTATLHQDEVVFTDRKSATIFKCDCTSLISSCTESSTTTEDTPLWTLLVAPDKYTTTISYSSRLVGIHRYGIVRGYCNINQSWITVARFNGVYIRRAAVLPTGDLVIANANGMYRVKVSGE